MECFRAASNLRAGWGFKPFRNCIPQNNKNADNDRHCEYQVYEAGNQSFLTLNLGNIYVFYIQVSGGEGRYTNKYHRENCYPGILCPPPVY